MPQADLKYSTDLEFDTAEVLRGIEGIIARHDDGAGACKGRAYPAAVYHHSHVLLELTVLQKPHRDKAFCDALVADLVGFIEGYLPSGTERAVELHFASPRYVTGIVA